MVKVDMCISATYLSSIKYSHCIGQSLVKYIEQKKKKKKTKKRKNDEESSLLLTVNRTDEKERKKENFAFSFSSCGSLNVEQRTHICDRCMLIFVLPYISFIYNRIDFLER